MAKKPKKAKAKAKRKAKPKSKTDQVAGLRRALFGLEDEIERLMARVQRLEDGHSGDPQAHAALAPELQTESQQPSSEPEQAADEPARLPV